MESENDPRLMQMMAMAELASKPIPAARAIDVIRRKRDGHELTADEIASFVDGATRGSWEDYQLSALLMAIFLRGMTPAETAELTRRMTDSGQRLDLSELDGPKVDKHSTGGVGDKTSLILAPLVAACGAIVPMMSGRGLGHTGGTLDKLEAIPGFRVDLTEQEFRTALNRVGIGMIGQTANIAPADKKLYALRDVTSTVESIPLITASILSKKLAEGISALVLDVKVGRGAFMKSYENAKALAESLVQGARDNGLTCNAVLTNMDAPLGCAVGNSLEVIESIETLKGRGPKDLTDLSVRLAAQMVHLAGVVATPSEAHDKVMVALHRGAGLEKFRRMVEQQGGDPHVVDDYSLLPRTSRCNRVISMSAGYIQAMDAEAIGIAAMRLGAGRQTAKDRIDPAVGIILKKKPGDAVQVGEPIFEVHYSDQIAPRDAIPLLQQSYRIVERKPHVMPLLLESL